jgi:FtsP/CotA-like multicopper oxidase with cupredoxin domain
VYAPNALAPSYKFKPHPVFGRYSVSIRENSNHLTGLIDPKNGRALKTTIWGYGDDRGPTWPGRTFEVLSSDAGGPDSTMVRWANELQGKKHLLPVDTNLHWAYSLHGNSSANGVDYRQYSIKKDGVPIITHLHGGHSDFQYDGNPEFFYSPDGRVKGPQWDFVDGGFTNLFGYDNRVPAGTLWYHDHALGITRLNVYAGLAGFYFVRDQFDTGKPDNPLGLPAYPYELAYAIQDRMFYDDGSLFYPAFPGDPFYDDFITGEGAVLPPDLFPGGGPTALAEFFGDHMVVNGKIWPKEDVEPRNYRMRLLNGTDSRFMVLQFVAVNAGETDFTNAGAPIPFYVIGSDQGLAGSATMTDTLVFEPGSRYDIVFDFSGLEGKRIIMKNIGGDEPFGGTFTTQDPDAQVFGYTDRVMAFDVVNPLDTTVADSFDPTAIDHYGGNTEPVNVVRKVGLFEGKDEFGRLQPLLGTVAQDLSSATAYTWFQPTTETPSLHNTEEWEIYNFTGDAHPIHLHLVNFQILGRNEITFDADEDNPQQVLQHNGEFGTVAAVSNISEGGPITLGASDGYVENAPKDLVTALPEQVTRIRATFDKPGRYVWHCHILSHEDHEMMRVLEVEPS